MKVLRFDHELYRKQAAKEVIRVFSPYGKLEHRSEAGGEVIQIEAKDDALEQALAGEIGNYFLGLTVDAQSWGQK